MSFFKRTTIRLIFYFIIVGFLAAGCEDNGDTEVNPTGPVGEQSMSLKLDLGSSKGAVVTDGSSNSSASVAAIHYQN